MTDQLREQVSAFVDGELPAGEIGLLVRRMERDPQLQRAFSSYVLAGEALQAPGGITASPGFAARVSAAISAPDAVVAPAGPARGSGRWKHPAVATAIAAGTAVIAVLLIRPEPEIGGVAGRMQSIEPATDRAEEAALSRYGGSSPTPAQSQRLAGYFVAHSQFSSPIGRRNVWSGVLAADSGITRAAYDVRERP